MQAKTYWKTTWSYGCRDKIGPHEGKCAYYHFTPIHHHHYGCFYDLLFARWQNRSILELRKFDKTLIIRWLMSIWTWFKNWILPLILNFHVNKAEMQQIIIEKKQKLSCCRQQNQKKCEYSTRSQFKNSIRPNSAEKRNDFFLKILYKQLFWLVGPVGKKLSNLPSTIN